MPYSKGRVNEMKHLAAGQSILHYISITTIVLLSMTVSPVKGVELLGYWAFEETDFGADAVDSSGNDINGTYEGEANPDAEGAPGFGSGLELDGFDSSVWLGPGDENGLGDLTSGFSVMAWIKPDQFGSKNRVLGSVPWEANSGWGWGTVRDELEITTWGVKDYDQPVPLELEEWAHVAIVLDEDFEAFFYHNGEEVGSVTHPSEGGPTINDFYIGVACCPGQESFSGFLDEVAVFEGTLTAEQVNNAMTLGVLNYDGGGPTNPFDFDGDGSLGEGDINILSAAIATGSTDLKYDVNSDSSVSVADLNDFVTNPSNLNTWIGDANLDNEFNSSDLVAVFTTGKYEVAADATWGEGDWNADQRFNSGDLVAAFTDGGYEQGARPAAVAAVPEPSSLGLLLSALAMAALSTRRRR